MALKLADQRRRGGVCTIARVLAAAGPQDRKTILAWLTDQSIPSTRVADSLSGKIDGIRVTDFTVRRHRLGRCLCGQ